MVSLFLLLIELISVFWLEVGANFTKPNCINQCGDIKIPYPFGIGASCYYNTSYEIFCDQTFHPPKPFLRQFNLEVLDINWPGRYTRRDHQWYSNDGADDQRLTVATLPQNLCESEGTKILNMTPIVHSYDFRHSPYRFSAEYNVFMVEGCGGGVMLKNKHGTIKAGCASVCGTDASSFQLSNCYGFGCCQSSFSSFVSDNGYLNYIAQWDNALDFYQIVLDSEPQFGSNSCNTSAAVIEEVSAQKLARKLSKLKTLPTVLIWKVPHNLSMPELYGSSCYDFPDEDGCVCSFPYEGNPYIPYGCQVAQECRNCKERCDTRSDISDSSHSYFCDKKFLFRPASVAGFSSGIGVVLLVFCCYWLHRYLKKRKEIKQKVKYFKRNGGFLLKQQMSSNEGVVEKTKIFMVSELENATDSFNENRILGQGGQGTVYKGMLMDGRIVAIKKSKKIDESQVEQFINEVVILSQINHRNVVRLLGCCLETEVPILVYEFIANGTLYQHIHEENNEFHANWGMRLQIAAESAGALSYLHSSSSTPIYHRDIKSTNILLDDKYRAKVSDFGTSRAITIEQTHVTTCVLGTYGYLDPEYFQSNQFTEKSDVYSFGVVLVELITGKKPICPNKSGGWISLATEFLTQMEESRLFEILDTRILDEGKKDEFIAVAELARTCLNMNGKQRPTMKEIAVFLDRIRAPYMPSSKGLNLAECNHVVAQELNKHEIPFTKSVSSSENHPPAWSIEVQPLMASNLTI